MTKVLLIEHGETSEEIIAHAAKRGVRISRDQLKYWRENQAIPGLGIPMGSPTGLTRWMYPQGTARQALVLAHLMKKGWSLSDATWRLWRHGFYVGVRWRRVRLERAALQLDGWISEIKRRALIGDGEALSDEMLSHLETEPRIYNSSLAQSRKLVGSRAFPTFFLFILRLALGKYGTGGSPTPDQDDEVVVFTGLGLKRRFIDSLPMAEKQSMSDARRALRHLAEALTDINYGKLVSDCKDAEFEAAGLELVALRSNHQFLFATLDWFYGRHALGLGHGVRTVKTYEADQQASFLIIWLAVRRHPYFSGRAQHEILLMRRGDAFRAYARSLAFKDLLSGSPGLAEVWTPEFIHHSWRTSRTHHEHSEKLRRAVIAKLIGSIAARGRQMGYH